jgi:hypothetical protein
LTTWTTVRHGLSLSDPLGRPLAVKSPEPRRGPRRDLEFAKAQAEMSRQSAAALMRSVYGNIVAPSNTMLPEPDKRPTHSGWPTGKEGWSL